MLYKNKHMTEIHLQQNPIEAEQSRIDSMSVVNGLEQSGISIEDKAGVASSLDTLRSEFGIEDSVFDDAKTRLVMTSIADRLNHIETDADAAGIGNAAELEYVADLVMLAVGPQTQYAEQHAATMDTGVSDERIKAAYDTYTQPEVSREIDDFIRGEAFDALRTRLGVTEETPYEVRVLSIDSEGSSQSFGLVPEVDFGEEQLSLEESQARMKEREYRQDYIKGLRANSRALNEALGREGDFAPAWVSTFKDGTQYLCLALPTAEKVLYKDEERAPYYKEYDYEHDLAMVEHEYTHTQKMMLFDGHVGLGIALEELRAEYFSGNKQGYMDIKRFFMGMHMATGYSVSQSFEKDGAPYDEEAFLTDIAKNVGLGGLLDAMTAIPGNYAADEGASPYIKAVVAHNGGSLSSHFEQMYDRIKQQDGEDVVEARTSEFIDNLRDKTKGSDYVTVESVLHYGGLASLGRIGSENFRRRYPDESDDYDYGK